MESPHIAPVSHLPVDVFELILREFNLNTNQGKSSLVNCSVVSKAWRRAALPQLFRSVHSRCGMIYSSDGDVLPEQKRQEFEDAWGASEMWPLFLRLNIQPSLGSWIRELKLESANFIRCIENSELRWEDSVKTRNQIKEDDFIAALRLLPRLLDLTLKHVVVTPSEDHSGFESRCTGFRLSRLTVCFGEPSNELSHEDDLGHILKCFDEVDELTVSGYRGVAPLRVFGQNAHGSNINLRSFDNGGDSECAPIYSALAECSLAKTLSRLSLNIGPGESYPHAKSLNALLQAMGGNLSRFQCHFWARQSMSDNEEGRIRLDHCSSIRYLSFDVFAPFPWRVIARLLETLPSSAGPARIEFRVFPVFRAAVAEREWTADTEAAVILDLVLANLKSSVKNVSIVFRFNIPQGPPREYLKERLRGDFYRLNRTGPLELVFE